MPIVVGLTSAPSSIGNYSGLITSIVDTLKDDALEERAPDFIRLAEAWFNRELYPLNDETTESLALADAASSVDLPTDFKKVRTLYLGSDPSAVLTQLGPDDFRAKYLDSSAARPVDFAIQSGSILIGPAADADYTLSLTYVKGLTYLSQANQSNWLIEQHPDLYFHGALMYAELDGWNDDRALGTFASTAREIIGQVKFWDAQRRKGDNHATVAGTYF